MENNNEFTVMTLNAGGARRVQTTSLEPQQLSIDLRDVIWRANIHPDIIAVQECHRVWFPNSAAYLETSDELAQRLGTSYQSFFSPDIDRDSHAHPRKWKQPAFEGYNRVMQGNAIIVNMEKMSLTGWPWHPDEKNYPGYSKLAPISTQISIASLYSTGNRDTEPRNILVVPLKLKKDISLYFMATHLTTLSEEDRHNPKNPRSQEASNVRLAQVKEILRIVDELRRAEQEYNLNPKPIILAGDFNAIPAAPEIQHLQTRFSRPSPHWHTSSKTLVYTHVSHQIHVDYVFYDDPDNLLTLRDCFILEQNYVRGVTDHLPVIAKFKRL
jgi:endonuclease/exonuclease/phosphatase family metal-dependent hydrolase